MNLGCPPHLREGTERAFALRLDRLIDEAVQCAKIASDLGRPTLRVALDLVVGAARAARTHLPARST